MANTIYVAYAYSKEDPLNKVPAELEDVIAIFKKTTCAVEREDSVTQEALEGRLGRLKKDLLVFHYSGHAGGTGLELNDSRSEEMNFIDMSIFAQIIGQDGQGLKLVFLNGCSTRPQVKHLRAQGVPAVIATTWPLDDNYGYLFARRFYANFVDKDLNYTLEQAFKRTLASFQASQNDRFVDDQGKIIDARLLDVKFRGNLDVDLEKPSDIYELEGDAAVLQQRFADWQQPAEKPNIVENLDKPGTAPDRKWDQSYLLCDRDGQVRDFHDLLENKKAGTLANPCFLFIHDYGKNCPLELAKRFKLIELRDAFPQKIRLEELDFPLPEDFDNVADPQKPLHYLGYLYAQKFSRDGGKTYDQVLRRYQYGEFSNDLFVVVHHQLPVYFWHEGIRPFFEYYVRDFSTELPEGLRKQLLIICTFDYTDDPDELANAQEYRALFKDLSEDPAYQGRILHYPNLPVVYAAQVRQWYSRVFDGSTLRADKYVLPPKMDFQEAIPIMQTIITDYNNGPR